MCVVVDSCCLAALFNSKDSNHKDVSPVRNWIVNGAGKLVIGGKKYKKELAKLSSLIPIVAELSRKGKVVAVSDSAVDKHAAEITRRHKKRGFNDQHLVAIVIVSGVRVICTIDKSAHPHLKRKDLYPDGARPPKIYQNPGHSGLLCKKNIVGACSK